MRTKDILFVLCCVFIMSSACARENLTMPSPDPSRARVLPLTSQRYLNSGLPETVRQGYNEIDSICRSMEVFRFDEMIGLIGSYDALRPYLSTIYFLSDYDPLLYIQHMQYSPTTCAHAYFAPERIQYDVFARLASLHVSNARRVQALVSAAGIYAIRVTSISTDTVKSYNDSGKIDLAKVRMTITANVIDTIKGKHWLPGKNAPISSADNGSGDEIRFSFDPAGPSQKNTVFASMPDLKNYAVQVTSALPPTYGDYQWSVGSEYIVFLQFGGY